MSVGQGRHPSHMSHHPAASQVARALRYLMFLVLQASLIPSVWIQTCGTGTPRQTSGHWLHTRGKETRSTRLLGQHSTAQHITARVEKTLELYYPLSPTCRFKQPVTASAHSRIKANGKNPANQLTPFSRQASRSQGPLFNHRV